MSTKKPNGNPPEPKPLGTLERDLLDAAYTARAASHTSDGGWFKPVYPGQAGHLKNAGLLEKRQGGEFRLTEKGYAAMGKPFPQPGDGLPPSDPTDDIGTAGPVIQPGEFQIEKPGLDGTPEVLIFPGGTEAYLDKWLDEHLTWEPPPVQAITAEQVSGDPLMVAIMKDAATDKKHIAELERKLAEEEPKRAEAWAQVASLKAELVEKDGELRSTQQNLVLAQQEIASLRTVNGVQCDMLREATGQGAKVEFKTLAHGFQDYEASKHDDELAALTNEGWTKWDSHISSQSVLGTDGLWFTRIITFVRPILKPTASPDLTAQRDYTAQTRMVQAVGQPMTIITPPAVPEPSLSQLSEAIRQNGMPAVLAQMDANAKAAGIEAMETVAGMGGAR